MCGIGGILHTTHRRRVDSRLLARMSVAMAHRGPDGHGQWIHGRGHVGLVHRRLSVVDLSHGADQPMTNEDGRLQIVFNGEIYNHRLLRNTLLGHGHQFKTDHADTEVLLHGYEQWGLDGLLQRLEGMFAFALWDDGLERLYLVRDRIGIKPLYWSRQNDMLLFASEIKGILAHPEVRRGMDGRALYDYLTFMVTPAPQTLFEGIHKVAAGHYLQWDAYGEVAVHRYWDPCAMDMRNATEAELIDQLRSLLENSVHKHMMADVPVGVFLSGGMDSATNVALMSRHARQPLHTFTVGFKDHPQLNELEEARRISDHFQTHHHEVQLDGRDMEGYLTDLIHHQDEPIADWVCIPLHFVSRLAAEHVKVVQVGEGADEQFCGYGGYLDYLRIYERYFRPLRQQPGWLRGMAGLLAGLVGKWDTRLRVPADFMGRAAGDREHFWGGATVFWEGPKRALVEGGRFPAKWNSYEVIGAYRAQLESQRPDADVLNRMIYYEFMLRLPELLLMRVDKITMAHSLEARVPFLDHKLVEFSMGIPMGLKVPQGYRGPTKHLLKQAVQGWIPQEVIDRPKRGFGAPMSAWLRGSFGDRAQAEIESSPLLTQGYFKRSAIRRLFEQHRRGGRDNGVYLWTLYNLTAWYAYWIEGGHDPGAGAVETP